MGQLYKPQRVVFSKQILINALNEAWRELYGEYPTKQSLATLCSQCCLETGIKSCWNLNFGNIKRYGDHDWTAFRCSEIIKGREVYFDPPHVQTRFCSYLTPIQGAKEYIEFISKRKRYAAAWQAVMNGDPKGFSLALSKAGYYTASVDRYTIAVLKLFSQFMGEIEKHLVPGFTFPTYSFVPITEDFWDKPEDITPVVPVPDMEPESDLPNLADFGLEMIRFDWTNEPHILDIEPTETLEVTGFFNQILAALLKLVALFTKK